MIKKYRSINISDFKTYKKAYLFVRPNNLNYYNNAATTLLKKQLPDLIKISILKAAKKAKLALLILLQTIALKKHKFNNRTFLVAGNYLNKYYNLFLQRYTLSCKNGSLGVLTAQPLIKKLQLLFYKNQNNTSYHFKYKNQRYANFENAFFSKSKDKRLPKERAKLLTFLRNRLLSAISFKFRNFFFFAKTRRFRPEGAASFEQFEAALRRNDSRRFLLYLHRYRSSESLREKAFKWAFFKKLFKMWLKRYRHIQKNKLFLSIFKAMFTRLTATHEKKFQNVWHFFRKFKRHVGGKSGITYFSRYIFMRPELLLVLLGLVPNKKTGRLYAASGICTINGGTGNLLSESLIPGDICQISPILWKQAKTFQNYFHWDFIKTRFNKFSFITVDWAIFAFIIVKWPKGYEITAPKFLTERWLRYYVRNLPVRKRKPRKFKMFWKGYVVSFLS